MKKNVSENFSFSGWNIWRFIKGRKKTIITVVASVCGYFALNQDLTGLVAGPVFEGVWSVVEYYFKTIEK
jgi:hypothetical protein